MKHAPQDEEARLDALHRYAILDSPPEQAFDHVVGLAAQLLRMPMAAISFIDRDRQWFKARLGITAPETSRETAFCDHTIRADRVLVVADATKDDRFKNNPVVTSEAGIRFYAAAPVKTSDGFRIGTLCVVDRVPRPDYDDEKGEMLARLAGIVGEMLEMRLAGQALTHELRGRLRAEERLRLLQDITKASAEAADFSTAVVAALRLLSDHLGADGAQVWSLGAGMRRCELDAAYVAPGSGLEAFMKEIGRTPYTPENSIVGQTIVQQRVYAVINGPDADFTRFPVMRIALDHGILSFVGLPFRGLRTRFALGFLFKKVHADLAGVADFIRDISGEIETILARKESEDRLREAERMEALGQLTAGIAHVLNNALTVIIGNLDRSLDIADMPEVTRRNLAAALAASGNAADCIEKLLAFSRNQYLQSRPIDLNDQIADQLPNLAKVLAGIELRTELAAELWPVRADPSPFDKALLALAENAREASAAGGAVTITTRNIECGEEAARRLDVVPGQYVAVSIGDEGAGMPREVAARAFEPFFTTRNPAQHTGLGLSQVYGFARQSGGAVEIESTPGSGTKISLILPRAAARENEAARSIR